MQDKNKKTVKIESLVKSNNTWANILYWTFQAIVVLTIAAVSLAVIASNEGSQELTSVATILLLVLSILEIVYLVAFIIGTIFYCINLGCLRKEGASHAGRNVLGVNLIVCLIYIGVSIASIVLGFVLNGQQLTGAAGYTYLAFEIVALFIPLISFILVKSSKRLIFYVVHHAK